MCRCLRVCVAAHVLSEMQRNPPKDGDVLRSLPVAQANKQPSNRLITRSSPTAGALHDLHARRPRAPLSRAQDGAGARDRGHRRAGPWGGGETCTRGGSVLAMPVECGSAQRVRVCRRLSCSIGRTLRADTGARRTTSNSHTWCETGRTVVQRAHHLC